MQTQNYDHGALEELAHRIENAKANYHEKYIMN